MRNSHKLNTHRSHVVNCWLTHETTAQNKKETVVWLAEIISSNAWKTRGWHEFSFRNPGANYVGYFGIGLMLVKPLTRGSLKFKSLVLAPSEF